MSEYRATATFKPHKHWGKSVQEIVVTIHIDTTIPGDALVIAKAVLVELCTDQPPSWIMVRQ